jgi:hypothetical protein
MPLNSEMYWNVVDSARPHVCLMGVSTTNYVLASKHADDLRRENPDHEYRVIRTSELNPYRREVGR